MSKDKQPKCNFTCGEKVLCFHGPLMYEAKCLNTKLNDAKDEWLYHVHYQGWSKNWDEWVTDKRIFKYDDNGLKKQADVEKMVKNGKKLKAIKKAEQLKQETEKEDIEIPKSQSNSQGEKDSPPQVKEEKSVKSTIKSQASSITSNRKRKSRVGDQFEEPGLLDKASLTLTIPINLRNWLLDDWDLVSRQSMLLNLPSKKPISKILSDYLDTMMNTKKEDKGASLVKPKTSALKQELRNECVFGLLLYFDTLLGSHLLYRFERLQYGEICKQNTDKKVSTLYGAPHLLRLFAKMTELAYSLRVDGTSMSFLAEYLNEILEFISLNESSYFFLDEYSVASPEYQRRAMC
ncbi:Mortality factor 4-like protein 2 [Cichlidogyrus casuarinus]|uniref:Mortality factor 4-like protein 2 n=1 Tax=Cichlidogyrus casuarinus TaxID=1844966 RepID=A0ABD2QEB4_9PLAT